MGHSLYCTIFTASLLLKILLAIDSPLLLPRHTYDDPEPSAELSKDQIEKIRESIKSILERIRKQKNLPSEAEEYGKLLQQAGAFEWGNCGGGFSNLIQITKIEINPHPIPAKGDVYFTIHVTVSQDLVDPIKVEMRTKRKTMNTWEPVDCQGYWGTCTFENICPLLAWIPICPPQLLRQVPCKCPFKKGMYHVDNSRIQADLPSYAKGEYQTTVLITRNEQSLGCFKFSYTVA